jgi:phytoene synthase
MAASDPLHVRGGEGRPPGGKLGATPAGVNHGQGLSPCGALARRHDPDRFLCALFAPADRRETLFVLTAFNHELARAREAASNPVAALIRLQWWREVVEGIAKRHEVATPLRAELDAGRLAAEDLLALIAGRETEADDSIPDQAAWLAYLRATAGRMALTAGRVLGAPDPALVDLGAAYGAAGVMRTATRDMAGGRCRLPADTVGEPPQAARLAQALPALARVAQDLLGAGPVPRAALPAALPAVLARRDLGRLARGVAVLPRGLADRFAVMWAALRGRL